MEGGDKVSTIAGFQAAQRMRSQSDLFEARLLTRIVAAQEEIVRAGLDPHKVVDVVTRRAQELTRSTGAVVEIVEGDKLIYWSASGAATAQLGLHEAIDASISGLCVRTGRVLRCDDSETDPRVDIDVCRRVGLRSALVAPLPYGDTVIGVLKVIAPAVNAYQQEDVRTLELLSSLIGATLSHAVRHAAIEAELNSKVEADKLESDDHNALRERIQKVIECESFRTVYQPVIELESGKTVGYEALARFTASPRLPPDRWFDDAVRTGLGLELELAVARRALQALPRMPDDTYLCINVSPAAAVSKEIERMCMQFAPHRIVLEITEHSFVDDYALLSERTRALRRLGVRLAIDDAGAGFASLRHVLRLEPDLIKLDMSIVHDIDIQLRHQSLASALLTFANGTSASILAEGIETQGEFETLKRLGVTYGQGHFLGYPAALPF